MNSYDPIVLSVVATSRNDNHGKNLLYRMQTFVDGFIQQCKTHNLRAELILVEWNPPDDTLPLSQALIFPIEKGPCVIRIIQVPKAEHAKLDHADKIPLFQMIGKNVGIRRAKGKFVLATNIDVLFSDALIEHLKTKLQLGCLYRVDRLDVPEKLPENTSYDTLLSFCSKNILRINAKPGTILTKKDGNLKRFFQIIKKTPCRLLQTVLQSSITDAIKAFKSIGKKTIRWVLCTFYPSNTIISHTNACGDFTLLSSQDWAALRGYPEWNTFSWHIDELLIHQARQHGIKEKDLSRNMPIYHIEHEAGSGFSPENAHILFKRLHEKGIPYINDATLIKHVYLLKRSKDNVVYNDIDWGMARLSLEEIVL